MELLEARLAAATAAGTQCTASAEPQAEPLPTAQAQAALATASPTAELREEFQRQPGAVAADPAQVARGNGHGTIWEITSPADPEALQSDVASENGSDVRRQRKLNRDELTSMVYSRLIDIDRAKRPRGFVVWGAVGIAALALIALAIGACARLF